MFSASTKGVITVLLVCGTLMITACQSARSGPAVRNGDGGRDGQVDRWDPDGMGIPLQ